MNTRSASAAKRCYPYNPFILSLSKEAGLSILGQAPGHMHSCYYQTLAA